MRNRRRGVGAMPTAPDGSGLTVVGLEPRRALVLRHPDGNWTWVFELRKSAGGTRLLIRNRWTTANAPTGFRLCAKLIEPGMFVMERKMMLGIKDRAEGTASVKGTSPAPSDTRDPVEVVRDR